MKFLACVIALLVATTYENNSYSVDAKQRHVKSKNAKKKVLRNPGTEIFEAIKYNNIQGVNSEISKNFDAVNARDISKNTPLILATTKKNIQIVKILIDQKANVNYQNVGGATALHVASRNGNIDIARLLLSANADVNIKDAYGYTPILRAIMNSDIEMFLMLIEFGAKCEISDIKSFNINIKKDNQKLISIIKDHCK
jgi:ankyrin repeat protein